MVTTKGIPKGTILSGKYRIDRELGRGGMARVYQATNVDIGKKVAIKLLAGHLAASSTVVERFLREARAVSRIRSQHICDVYDSGQLDEGTPFLVLELLEGESLYELMCRERQMSAELTLAIILQSARGLAKAHSENIVHRDLKPENIYVCRDGDGRLLIKLLDFGLAKFYDPLGHNDNGKNARLTRDGAVFGTPAYMSPEQVRGQAAADTRADLWALACIAYECFTGTTVWSTEEGVAMTFAQIATAPLPDPARYRPDLPASFTAWYHRALNRDIDARYQTVKDFANGLAEAFEYTSRGGGLDATLINHLSHLAISQVEPQTMVLASTPPPPIPSAPKVPSSSSPVTQVPHTADRPSMLPDFVGRGKGRLKVLAAFAGMALLVTGVVYAIRPAPKKPDEARGIKEAATKLFHSAEEETSGYKIIAKHPWLPAVRTVQSLIVEGDYTRADAVLKKAMKRYKHQALVTLAAQVAVAQGSQKAKAPCLVTGLARPRLYDLLGQKRKAADAKYPAIVRGLRGAVVSWADARDGQQRAYAAVLDDALKNTALPVDVAPEASWASSPNLVVLPPRYLAAYSVQKKGSFLRWLGADGAIADAPITLSDQKKTQYLQVSRHERGLLAVWAGDTERDAVDVFYRLVDRDGKPLGKSPVRATDYVNRGKVRTWVRSTSGLVHDKNIIIVFEHLLGRVRSIRALSVPIGSRPPGIPVVSGAAKLKSRVLGTEVVLTAPRTSGAKPSIACVEKGCFVAWTGIPGGGAHLAFLDPKTVTVRWQKRFSAKGMNPSLAVSATGEVRIAWTEHAKLITTSVGPSGVGPDRSTIGRMVGDQPPASIVAGNKKGEWYFAWLDYEGGHRELYATRVNCE